MQSVYGNNPTVQWTDEWIKKLQHRHISEYYAATRKDKILSFAAIWIDLEGIV